MTATAIVTVDTTSFTTDAKFRTWGSAVSAAIIASGVTQTADTGQINWTTVTKPGTNNTKAGYEVYRFNDSLQASAPIFFRIDYGTGAATAAGTNPSTWLTVGTGSDGAGNITGVGMAVSQAGSSTTSGNNAASSVGAAYSTSAGSFTLLGGLLAATNAHGGLWNISRTCSTAGAPNGNGVTVARFTGSSSLVGNVRGAAFSPASAFAQTNPGVGAIPGSATASSGTVIQLYRQYAVLGQLYPTLGSVGYFSTDIVTLSTFACAPFGSTTHTYIAVGSTNGNTWESSSSFSNIIPAFIWE